MNKEVKKTILKMSLGIAVYEIVLAVSAIFIAKYTEYSLISLELGILVGTLVLYGMLINMALVNEDILASKDEKYANRKTVLNSALRKVAIIIVVAIFWNSKYVNVLAIIFAILGMKPGAYLSPLADKFIS